MQRSYDLLHEWSSHHQASRPDEVGGVEWIDGYALSTVDDAGPLGSLQGRCEVTMIEWPAGLIKYRMGASGEAPYSAAQVDKWQ